MQDKDFISYEYRTKTVKAKDQIKIIDMYEAFGWEVASTAPAVVDGVTITFKRDRKQKHKQELTKLERQAEDTFMTINGLHRAKTMGASIFAYIFGILSTHVFGGGMCLCMLTGNNIPAFAGGIILGVAGIALCGINYLIYKKIVAKKTKSLLPVIDETEEKFANLLEKGNDLLKAELI